MAKRHLSRNELCLFVSYLPISGATTRKKWLTADVKNESIQ
jgi:hypothetical protein